MDIDAYRDKFFDTLASEYEIYNAMIEDVYHLSRNIKRKHKFLALAAYAFLSGIVLVLGIYAYAANIF